MGIAARLGVSFTLVACLAILSNVVAEYGSTIVTTIKASRPPQPRVPAAVKPAIVTEPHLTAAQPPAPPSPSPTTPTEWHELQAAVERFARATVDALQSAGSKRSREFALAAQHLEDSSRALAANATGSPGAGTAQSLATRSRALRRYGEQLLVDNDTRRARFADYRLSLDTLDHLLEGALDHNWKIFGHIFARQSLLTLIAQANDMRSAVVQVAGELEPGAYAQGATLEANFAKTLTEHQAELRRAQGPEWLQQVRDAYATGTRQRTELVNATQLVARDRSTFDRDAAALALLARTPRAADVHPAAPPRPLPAPPGHSQPQATVPAHSPPAAPQPQLRAPNDTITAALQPVRGIRVGVAVASGALVLMLLFVSITTVRSIVRPIRQFVATTRRLADGDPAARFIRGGIAELDFLAVSLNGMAQTLETAQAATREYQGALEVRIDERTRQLQHLALHDSLTGLPNRRQLHSHLTTALLSAGSSGHRVAVYFIDLDNFKNINDSMGHTFGDRVLQAIAQRLREATGHKGFAARLGGDEFMVVYQLGEPASDAARHGEVLVTAFHHPLLVESRDLLVSVSVGGSVFPDHADSADALMRAADTALFSAKTLGRNQFSVFTPELLERAAIKFDIEQGLRRAVERNEFELVFQPEVDFQQRRVVLAEALLRWRLPDRRHMSPAHFLAVAKEAGLSTRINDWVVGAAIERVAQWRAGPWPEARVAINVSASQLIGARFLDQIQQLLATHRLPAHCIEIELTEDILQTGSSTIAVLRELRSAGLSLALDDFGTGFSTFSSLQQLPLTRVKLDQSLVACVDTDPRSAAIAGAIIGLCDQLGLTVTAEGIERIPQVEQLYGYGPICLQGYLISHPLAAADLPGAVAALPRQLTALSAHMNARSGTDGRGGHLAERDPLLLDLQASQSA